MSEEDFENEGGPALVSKSPKKVVTSEPELPAVAVGKVVGDFAVDPSDLVDPSAPSDLFPVRIELSRLVFRAGMKNSQSVRYLQDLLREQGYVTDPDPRGWLAEATREAVRAFQDASGLPATGLADEGTVEALFAVSREYVWDR